MRMAPSSKCAIPAWLSNHMLSKVWDEVTYPFPNFNGCTVEVLEMISYFIPHFIKDVITYPCWGMNSVLCTCYSRIYKEIASCQVCCVLYYTLRWRHNDHDGVSNHQPHGCLLNHLFRRRLKKPSKLRVTGLWAGNSPGPVNSPHKGPVTRKMFPFDDVIMVILIPWPDLLFGSLGMYKTPSPVCLMYIGLHQLCNWVQWEWLWARNTQSLGPNDVPLHARPLRCAARGEACHTDFAIPTRSTV